MSFETINILDAPRSVEGIDYMDIMHIFDRYRMKEGWEVWLKYKHLFPLKGFSIIHYPVPSAPTEYVEIAIINHKNFINIVNKHLSDFQSVLESKLTAQEILEEYVKTSGFIFNRIRNHDGLFGTLLGFGRDNAWEYMRVLGEGISQEGFSKEIPRNVQSILLPMFKVVPDTIEATELRESYQNQRQRINLIYQREDFLLLVLQTLTGSS